jgi:hypothetical protein
VVQVVKAVLGTWFRGWFSSEVFDGGQSGRDFVKREDFEKFTEDATEGNTPLLDECANA